MEQVSRSESGQKVRFQTRRYRWQDMLTIWILRVRETEKSRTTPRFWVRATGKMKLLPIEPDKSACAREGKQNFSLHMLDPSYLSHTIVGSSSGALGIPVWVLGEVWLEDSIRDGSQGMNLVRSPSMDWEKSETKEGERRSQQRRLRKEQRKWREREGFQLCSLSASLTIGNQREPLPLVRSYLGLRSTLPGEGSGKRLHQGAH